MRVQKGKRGKHCQYLRGDIDLELERRGLLIGERLRCRGGGGDLLGGLLGRLGGDLKQAIPLRKLS